MTGRAPGAGKAASSAGQVQYFIEESLSLDWPWRRITLLGGEPTLHPELEQILSDLARYKSRNASVEVRIITNGHGKYVNQVIAKLPAWITLLNTQKTASAPLFSPYNVAPVDLEDGHRDRDYSRGCAITEWCGIGLTRYGYYPCGAGGALDRVHGLDIGIKAVKDVTPEALREQLSRLCRLCGHFLCFDEKVDYVQSISAGVAGPEVRSVSLKSWTVEQQTSKSWQAAYQAYRRRAPCLSLYGR